MNLMHPCALREQIYTVAEGKVFFLIWPEAVEVIEATEAVEAVEVMKPQII